MQAYCTFAFQEPQRMQLPPHIIDLIGALLDQGLDDENICDAVVQAWNLKKEIKKGEGAD